MGGGVTLTPLPTFPNPHTVTVYPSHPLTSLPKHTLTHTHTHTHTRAYYLLRTLNTAPMSHACFAVAVVAFGPVIDDSAFAACCSFPSVFVALAWAAPSSAEAVCTTATAATASFAFCWALRT